MGRIGLSVYSLNVCDDKAKRVNLNSLYKGKDIFQIVSEFMDSKKEKFQKAHRDDMIMRSEDWEILGQYDSEKNVCNLDYEMLRCIYGRIKTGDFGTEAEIINVDTGEMTHYVNANEAKVMPFDFMIAMPKLVNDQALVVLQTQGIYGIKTQLEYQLRTYIQKLDSSLILNFGKILPQTYVENYLNNGILKKLKIYRYDIPNDLVDAYGIIPTSKRKVEERVITSPEGFSKNMIHKIRQCLAGERAYCDIVEISDFEIDDLKLEFKLGKNKKTISMKNLQRVVVSVDIDDDVATSGGNPDKESIKTIMLSFVEEYEEQMGNYRKLSERYLHILKMCKKEGDSD